MGNRTFRCLFLHCQPVQRYLLLFACLLFVAKSLNPIVMGNLSRCIEVYNPLWQKRIIVKGRCWHNLFKPPTSLAHDSNLGSISKLLATALKYWAQQCDLWLSWRFIVWDGTLTFGTVNCAKEGRTPEVRITRTHFEVYCRKKNHEITIANLPL